MDSFIDSIEKGEYLYKVKESFNHETEEMLDYEINSYALNCLNNEVISRWFLYNDIFVQLHKDLMSGTYHNPSTNMSVVFLNLLDNFDKKEIKQYIGRIYKKGDIKLEQAIKCKDLDLSSYINALVKCGAQPKKSKLLSTGNNSNSASFKKSKLLLDSQEHKKINHSYDTDDFGL